MAEEHTGTDVRKISVPLDFVWKVVAISVAAYAAIWWSNADIRSDLREIKASQSHAAELQEERFSNLRREAAADKDTLNQRLSALDAKIARVEAEARMSQINMQELMKTILTRQGSR